ncbi:MAG TPA: hypothetical protein VF883_14155, partial [Thermoanaerobaculia bacterium]
MTHTHLLGFGSLHVLGEVADGTLLVSVREALQYRRPSTPWRFIAERLIGATSEQQRTRPGDSAWCRVTLESVGAL